LFTNATNTFISDNFALERMTDRLSRHTKQSTSSPMNNYGSVTDTPPRSSNESIVERGASSLERLSSLERSFILFPR